ncbi:hypothetical protein OIU79_009553 [Salix purpurea]|uniref:Uncharacterized protein n=1 Tax=Salix purpurea TaxID=77065 RepID=A0A9Q0T8R0_SALPP|nr:hypothetical protein OIU79_009553 [Salix purpurea]
MIYIFKRNQLRFNYYHRASDSKSCTLSADVRFYIYIYISKNHPTMHIGEVRVHVKQYDQYLSNSSGACLCEPDHINFERLGFSTFKYLSSCFKYIKLEQHNKLSNASIFTCI